MTEVRVERGARRRCERCGAQVRGSSMTLSTGPQLTITPGQALTLHRSYCLGSRWRRWAVEWLLRLPASGSSEGMAGWRQDLIP